VSAVSAMEAEWREAVHCLLRVTAAVINYDEPDPVVVCCHSAAQGQTRSCVAQARSLCNERHRHSLMRRKHTEKCRFSLESNETADFVQLRLMSKGELSHKGHCCWTNTHTIDELPGSV
jgi:hypothetical protein